MSQSGNPSPENRVHARGTPGHETPCNKLLSVGKGVSGAPARGGAAPMGKEHSAGSSAGLPLLVLSSSRTSAGTGNARAMDASDARGRDVGEAVIAALQPFAPLGSWPSARPAVADVRGQRRMQRLDGLQA